MRPTITEQLQAIRRILGDVVAPEVQAKYPSDILQSLLGNLKELQENWVRWLAHLSWENAEFARLVDGAAPRLSDGLRRRWADAAALAPADPFDYDGACAYNEALRGCVAGIVKAARHDAALAPDSAAITAVLAESIRRRV